MPESAFRPDVLAMLAEHGVAPTPRTDPVLVRNFVRDLYKYELRRLRDRYVGGEFPRREYWMRVETVKRRYPVLALRAREWLV